MGTGQSEQCTCGDSSDELGGRWEEDSVRVGGSLRVCAIVPSSLSLVLWYGALPCVGCLSLSVICRWAAGVLSSMTERSTTVTKERRGKKRKRPSREKIILKRNITKLCRIIQSLQTFQRSRLGSSRSLLGDDKPRGKSIAVAARSLASALGSSARGCCRETSVDAWQEQR